MGIPLNDTVLPGQTLGLGLAVIEKLIGASIVMLIVSGTVIQPPDKVPVTV